MTDRPEPEERRFDWVNSRVDGHSIRFWILVAVVITTAMIGFGAWWTARSGPTQPAAGAVGAVTATGGDPVPPPVTGYYQGEACSEAIFVSRYSAFLTVPSHRLARWTRVGTCLLFAVAPIPTRLPRLAEMKLPATAMTTPPVVNMKAATGLVKAQGPEKSGNPRGCRVGLYAPNPSPRVAGESLPGSRIGGIDAAAARRGYQDGDK